MQMQAHALRWAGAEAVALDYNWNRYTRIVDVGGAYGSFLARLLRRNRRARGVVFDQLQARPLRSEHWLGLLQFCRYIPYILGYVLKSRSNVNIPCIVVW